MNWHFYKKVLVLINDVFRVTDKEVRMNQIFNVDCIYISFEISLTVPRNARLNVALCASFGWVVRHVS